MKCKNATEYYYDYITQKDSVPSEVRRHLEQCSICKAEMELLGDILEQDEPAQKPNRPTNLQLHYELLNQWLSCDTVKPFLPLLLIPEMAVTYQTPVTAHIEKCPACQKDRDAISALGLSGSELMKAAGYLAEGQTPEAQFEGHVGEVLGYVKDRTPSPILTRMRLEQAGRLEQEWVSGSAVVDVEVKQSRPVLERRQPQKRSVPMWVSSGIAAAILLVVLLTVLPTQDAGAVDLEQIYTSLGSVQNVHIRMFGRPEDSPAHTKNVQNVHIRMLNDWEEVQNIWIAEGLEIRLIQSEDDVVFWDQRSEQVFRKHQGVVEFISQGSEMELERPWGLLPFKHISDLPASHDWEYLSEAVLEGDVPVQVYELTWKIQRSNNTVIEKKWRGYLDIHSHLPYRVEWLDEINGKTEVVMVLEISYPTDAECLKVIEGNGFQLTSYGDQNEMLDMFPPESKIGAMEGGDFLLTCPSAKAAFVF